MSMSVVLLYEFANVAALHNFSFICAAHQNDKSDCTTKTSTRMRLKRLISRH